MVEIHLLRRVLDAPLLLPGVAAAGVREAVGEGRVAAHLKVGVDHDDAGTLVMGTQGGKQTGSASAAHDDVVLVVPRLGNLGLGCLGNHGLKRAGGSCGGGCCADTSHGQTADETPARSARAHTDHPFALGRSPACNCGVAIELGVRVAARMCSAALRLDSSAYWHRAGNWGTHCKVVGAKVF